MVIGQFDYRRVTYRKRLSALRLGSDVRHPKCRCFVEKQNDRRLFWGDNYVAHDRDPFVCRGIYLSFVLLAVLRCNQHQAECHWKDLGCCVRVNTQGS